MKVVNNKKELRQLLRGDNRYISLKEFDYRLNQLEDSKELLVDIVKKSIGCDREAIMIFERTNKVKNKVYNFTTTIS